MRRVICTICLLFLFGCSPYDDGYAVIDEEFRVKEKEFPLELKAANSWDDFNRLYRRHHLRNEEIDAGVKSWYLKNHVVSSEIKEVILNSKIRLGMTDEQVKASWGFPDDINRSVYEFGIYEQWIYGSPGLYSFNPEYYVYFDDGKLTAWQD